LKKVLVLDIDGVITDGKATMHLDKAETKRIDYHDLDAVTLIRQKSVEIAFLTAENSPFVDLIAKRFGVKQVITGAKDKLKGIQSLASDLSVELADICYVGDSDRDAPALTAVGLGLAPQNATVAAKSAADVVLTSSGGNGAVAEAIGIILKLNEPNTEFKESILNIFNLSLEAHNKFIKESVPLIANIAQAVASTLRSGHKILIFGNGGSAADAQHFAGELVGRFVRESEPFAAIALTTDSSILTCVGNDWSFDEIFSRQIRALCRPGDMAVGLSTSGNSPNVLEGLKFARKIGAQTVGFTGKTGGKMRDYTDLCLCVPSESTPRIQELHLLAYHAICEVVEQELMT